MRIETFVLGELGTNCYVVWDEDTPECAIIDPGGDPADVIEFCQNNEIEPILILATHGHFDHIGGVGILKNMWNIPYCISSLDTMHFSNMNVQAQMFGCTPLPEAPPPDIDLAGQTETGAGNLAFNIIPTPGHSKGSVTFCTGDDIFCGDLIFQGSIGRTDIPGGDMQELTNSVMSEIFPREPGTLYPGHGPITDITSEKKYNPFFQ